MLYVLLPAYDEEDALPPLLARLRETLAPLEAGWRLVVVDDGSTDRTAAILREQARVLPLEVITHARNRGLGETIRDGIELIAERADPDDILVRMDCDDTHDPAYIGALLAKIGEGYDIVTTSRYAAGGAQVGVPLRRRWLSRGANLLMKLAFPIRGVQEYSSGYRAYRVRILQEALAAYGNRFIELKGMGFAGTVEKLVKCRRLGARCAEVPFVLRYDRKQSISKARALDTALGYLLLVVKHAGRRARRAPAQPRGMARPAPQAVGRQA